MRGGVVNGLGSAVDGLAARWLLAPVVVSRPVLVWEWTAVALVPVL